MGEETLAGQMDGRIIADFKAAAEEYYEKGLNVVPVLAKRPLVSWQRWETERQTQEEFDSLPFDKADGFALVCGMQAKNGMFFLAVDADTTEFSMKLLPITRMDRTPRGGLHFYYWSRENAKGEKHHALKLELLGQGNIVVVAPTTGYKRLNDNSPREIQCLKVCFEEAVVKLGGKPKRESIGAAQTTVLPKSVKRLSGREEEDAVRVLCRLWKEGYRNRLTMYYLGLCLKKGFSQESARRVISAVADRTGDPEKQARLELVRYHYSNRLNVPLKAGSGIREIIEELKHQ